MQFQVCAHGHFLSLMLPCYVNFLSACSFPAAHSPAEAIQVSQLCLVFWKVPIKALASTIPSVLFFTSNQTLVFLTQPCGALWASCQAVQVINSLPMTLTSLCLPSATNESTCYHLRLKRKARLLRQTRLNPVYD